MKTIILKLGGSIFMPEHIDTDYLKALKSLVEEQSTKYKFIIIIGGGVTCRKYQSALKEMGIDDSLSLDMMGIAITMANAELFHLMLKNSIILKGLDEPIPESNIVVAHGYEPGHSTDFDTMYLASRFDDKEIIVLSNISQVYTADPRNNPDAKAIATMSWDELNNIVGDEWKPGLNAPMDPKAVKAGMDQKVKVVFADGRDLNNLKNILDDKGFIGTTIE